MKVGFVLHARIGQHFALGSSLRVVTPSNEGTV